jgi:thiol-disulfide isomerase/thioredoxin
MKLLRYSWIILTVALPLAALGADATPAGIHTKGPAPLHISHGEEVTLSDYFVPGKTMVFDFYSEFCGPCRQLAPYLAKLHAARSDIAVVKIDINRPDHNSGIDWTSPVARQFGLQLIPHLMIVGPDGKTIADDGETSDAPRPATDKVTSWIEALQ